LDGYKNKKVLVTGHTGFKGAYMCGALLSYGTSIVGYALPPLPKSAYEVCGLNGYVDSRLGDIRDIEKLKNVIKEVKPHVVIHMAAQPLVLDGYNRPAYTFDTNVMGTVNVLECIRDMDCVESVLVITTDKVYENNEWHYGYRENDRLGGNDPYAASKACAEMVVNSYNTSFFAQQGLPVSSARAGNVIGGGDVSANRIIPDCVRATIANEKVTIRNPLSVRPYQHVLEPIMAYLRMVNEQVKNPKLAGAYNIGPAPEGCVTTEALVKIFCDKWGAPAQYEVQQNVDAPHEAGFLHLDCAKARAMLNWRPRWSVEKAIEKTVEWEKSQLNSESMLDVMNKQISAYLKG